MLKFSKFFFIILFLLNFNISKLFAKTQSCSDKDSRCAAWRRDGKCNNQDVQRKCPRSCETCGDITIKDLLRASMFHSAEKSIAIIMVFAALAIVALVMVIIKCFTCGAVCKSKGNMKGKTVVITGATSGIGLETVYHLASRGAKIIIGCRNLKKGFKIADILRKQTGQNFIEIRKLDLASIESVFDFADDCNRLKRIDVLINNAAMISGNKRSVTSDGYEKTFQVNYLSHYLLTKLLISKLKQNAPSRVINIADDDYQKGKLDFGNLQGQKGFNNYQAYYNSKLALMLFTKEAAHILKGTKVTINTAIPGRTSTNLWHNCFPYSFKLPWFLMKPYTYLYWKTADMGAETAYYCSLEKKLEQISGKVFRECEEIQIPDLDDEVARKLWEISERLIQPKRLSTTTKESVRNQLQDKSVKNHNHVTDDQKPVGKDGSIAENDDPEGGVIADEIVDNSNIETYNEENNNSDTRQQPEQD